MWPKRLLLLAHPFVAQREGAGAPRVGRLVARDRPSESEPLSIFAAGRDQPTSSGSNRFAIDSPLEEAGFELLVPP